MLQFALEVPCYTFPTGATELISSKISVVCIELISGNDTR